MDPVAGALSVAGLWLGVLALVRRSRERFVTPAFLLAAFVSGAISQHPAPPLTRLVTLVPFTSILAAIALDRLMAYGSRFVKRQGAVLLAGSSVVAAAVIWNVTALHRSIYDVHYGYGDGTTSELIRITRRLPAASRLIYVQNADNDMYNVDRVLDEYNLGDRTTYIRPFGPPALAALGEVAPPFAVVFDLKRDEEIQAVEESVERRFPGVRWHDSSPGQPWNVRYCSVPSGLIAPP